MLRLLRWIRSWFVKAVVVAPPVVMPREPTNSERFLKIVVDALGTEVTPKDGIPDIVACAEVIATLIRKLYPDFPILPSTKDLDWKLYVDKRFERILEPKAGAIIISPRTTTTNGHVGVCLSPTEIASNTSKTGIFERNYTYQSWISTFKVGRGLPIYLYRMV